MKKNLGMVFVAIIFFGAGYFVFNYIQQSNIVSINEIKIREFITQNISVLSPEKEVLGGTFYVTDFALNDNYSGVVSYEDGHMAYKAYVTFTTDKTGAISVTSFDIIE